MHKNIIVLVLGAALLAGCGKSKEDVAAEQAAAAQAQAAAEAAAKKAAGPTAEEKKQAAAEFIALICSSPQVFEDAETSIDTLEAFSGEGADKNEARKHFMRAQNYYRGALENEMTARGLSYEALMLYAGGVLPRQGTTESVNEFRALIKANCRGVDEANAERVLGGILFYCAAQTP
ncbi:MAG TPA: hypothetical protein DEQ38_13145 [Elusimicrobia bacterium]|nr:MAG: hypothetical protein A2089_14320 [Elusimicrobia bacterium GWD2_63_28]HCC49043.1 hypothetical protein [Elusimicrobiota bacterium]